MNSEVPLVINCQGSELVGILHQSQSPSELGALIIVAGGPQYRVGVNRQFVVMSRMFADAGIPTLRFDHRGVGDSSGEYKGFVDMHDDIEAAIDALQKANPSIKRVAIWGECESATAASFYAHQDSRVSGMFMVNPWIRTEAGQAQTYMKHYYIERLKDKAFWQKVFSGKFQLAASLKSFFNIAKQSSSAKSASKNASTTTDFTNLPLPQRLEKTTDLFSGSLYIVTSGKDFIAQEYKDYAESSKTWQQKYKQEQVKFVDMPDADHSFSRIEWRDELFDLTLQWLKSS